MQEIHSVSGKSNQIFQFKISKDGLNLVMRYGHSEDIEQGMAYLFPVWLYSEPKTARQAAFQWISGFPTAGEKVKKTICDFVEQMVNNKLTTKPA